ncbi:MAG TPA: hypothetical protein VMV47_00395 [Bacteroidales bacterium]|nr:hypothetical protein [Bacteroidales bacterium]
MRRIISIFILFYSFIYLPGQTPVGSWSDHLVYNSAVDICASSDEIYASTGMSVLVFNREYDELKKMSTINGLTEIGISAINWSEDNKTLVIAYITTNIDLVKNNIIYNIPDISRKYIPGKKEVNRIRIQGNYAYLACSFGIVLIDLVKKEIYDTWKPGSGSGTTEVWDLTFGDERIFAATGEGVFFADLSNTGLAYYGNWIRLPGFPDPSGKYTSVVWAGSKLYVNQSVNNAAGDYVYSFDGTATQFSYIPGVYNNSFEPASDGFIITSSSSVKHYGTDGSLIRSIDASQWPDPSFSQAIESNGEIWIADRSSGMIRYRNSNDLTGFSLPGPITNAAFNITSVDGKTAISAGGTDVSWNNLRRSLQVSFHEGTEWTSISSTSVSDGIRTIIDPDDLEHIFVASWGEGLLEYKNNELVKQYSYTNSPLQTIIPGSPYVRICGLAMDKDKNLWITQSEVQGSMKVLKPDGTWIVNPLTIDAQMIGDLIITRTGHKWIILPRGNGLFVFDDNHTPENFTDDRYKKMLIEESDGDIVAYVYSIAEDLEGNIWVGTDQGPLIYNNPERVFNENLKAFRVRIPRNDGSNIYDYLLKTETINSIAVDGANRKWLGTANAGAYLLSPDGATEIRKFTEENSPLFSNNIVSLAVDNKTGEVWFGTSKGVQSVRGDAIEGLEKFNDVYAFPNPVRQEFSGSLTVTGLMRDSRVKITDVSGNLVYETESTGGIATWDLNTYNGRRVATGVYLIFCSSNDGSKSCVIKVLVIK